jgi:hypothetical protein
VGTWYEIFTSRVFPQETDSLPLGLAVFSVHRACHRGGPPAERAGGRRGRRVWARRARSRYSAHTSTDMHPSPQINVEIVLLRRTPRRRTACRDALPVVAARGLRRLLRFAASDVF